MKLYVVLTIGLSIFVIGDVQSQSQEVDEIDDDWKDDYYWYDEEVAKLGLKNYNLEEETNKNIDLDPSNNENGEKQAENVPETANSYEKVKTEIEKYLESNEKGNNSKNDYDYYQIEDNRSNITDIAANEDKNKEQPIENPDSNVNLDSFEENDSNFTLEFTEEEKRMIDDLIKKSEELYNDSQEQELENKDQQPIKAPESVNPEDNDDEQVNANQSGNDFAAFESKEEEGPSQAIIDETKKILNEENGSFDDKQDTDNENLSKKESLEDPKAHSIEEIDEETAEQIYEGLDDDVKSLLQFWDELADIDDNDSSEDEKVEQNDLKPNSNERDDNMAENSPLNDQNNNDTPKETLETKTGEEKKETQKTSVKTDFTSTELNDLMAQFAANHFEDLDTQSDDFDKNIAPIHMPITVDDITIVTSPNYPEPYPNNNIIDWIFEGQGLGVEFNLTDFTVNGYSGDFLLVIPGGLDDTDHNGIIFSYHLNEPRTYRFLDVNRLFVRFESKSGVAGSGFQFSLKLIEPLKETLKNDEEEEEPAPIPLPDETLMIFVAGVNPEGFKDIAEEFRMIIADMASVYINRNEMDPGNRTTAEVTQILTVTTCNIHWPDLERCTAVKFGVPLADAAEPGLTERQLADMWQTLVFEDPFVSRMKRLGITEFAVPNGGSAMSVWLIIGVGVVLSAAMLAFALWRWSCIEDYTRMNSYNDTDSVLSGKKGPLDLYPTPHQTLPPLYDDQYAKYEYYDSHSVNIGGYTNKSFLKHNDFLDIDSDDDARALPATNRGFVPVASSPKLRLL